MKNMFSFALLLKRKNERSNITNNSKKTSFSGLLHVRSHTTTPGIGGYLQTEWATISKSI